MKKNKIILTFTFALIVFNTILCQQKEIVGYFPSWKWRSSSNIMTPDKIPYSKLTMINYAFWYPLPNGTIVGRDTVGDALNLDRKNGKQSLVDFAHKSNVKVVLSIGGWEDSNNFPRVAADDSLRKIFAQSCIEAIKKYGFDGIDIDWEYPGYADHKGTQFDKKNFTKLLRIIRDSLTSYGKKIGKKLFLTAALPAVSEILENYEISEVAELLDMLNIMTYDYIGSWNPTSGHNSPLYAPNSTDTLRNIDAAFKLYSERFRIASSKINLGIPFYGHTFSNCIGLNTSHQGTDTVLFSSEGAFYSSILKYVDRTNRKWDDASKVPYLVLLNKKILISYDDEESVTYKAHYVMEHKARGVIIWEITGDYLKNGNSPLLNTIYKTFKALPAVH